MQCPYADHENKAKPVKNGVRYYSTCPTCGRKARAIIYDRVDGMQSYSLVRTGKRSLDGQHKKVRTVRLSDSEMIAVENGKLRLTVINNRITITL